jgi:hypothetical protein
MEEEERSPWPGRLASAAFAFVVNAMLWFVLPSLLFGLISQGAPQLPITSGLIQAFGAVITALETLGALTSGTAVSVPLKSGGYLVSAYYIWRATDGGRIVVAYQGLLFGLTFVPLLYLFMLPSLFSAIRVPIAYLLEQSEAGQEAKGIS